jgi:hypothetical protein
VAWSSISFFKVFVGEANASKGLASVCLDDIVKLLLGLIIKKSLFTILVKEMSAGVKDVFSSTFGVESLWIAVFKLLIVVSIEFKNSGHSLSHGIKLESKHIFRKILLPLMLIVASASSNEFKHSKFSSLGISVSTNSVAGNGLVHKSS